MRAPGRTERETPAPDVPVCCCPTSMKIDGVEYDCKGYCDPGCKLHGLEAQTKDKMAYVGTPNDADDVLPVDMKGPELPHYMRRAPRSK